MCIFMNERMSIFSVYLFVCLLACLLNCKLIKKEEHANDFEVCTAACIIKYNGGSVGKFFYFTTKKKDAENVYYILCFIYRN